MATTVPRDKLVAHLDTFLRIADVPDSSPNGLQVQGREQVARVAYAVDVSVQTIRAAEKARADLMVVHHGLWWGRHQQITGTMHARVSALIHAELSLYAAHLPLDCHGAVGNNVELARLLRLRVQSPFGMYRGVEIGVIAVATPARPLASLTTAVEKKLGHLPEVLPFGPEMVRRIAIVSGAGAMLVEDAARAGCDTLLTGETSHAAVHPAREAGINLVCGGHYATETVGLMALQRHIRKKFSLPGDFLTAPTGY